MTEFDRQRQGRQFEGYAFTFCKAAFLVLIFRQYSLLALSGLATLFYILAWVRGVREYHCWAKPPWITAFWASVFAAQVSVLIIGPQRLQTFLHRVVVVAQHATGAHIL
jgi:hypothetical protein